LEASLKALTEYHPENIFRRAANVITKSRCHNDSEVYSKISVDRKIEDKIKTN
jgi:hypothetical protein